jgi:hypothetical protein
MSDGDRKLGNNDIYVKPHLTIKRGGGGEYGADGQVHRGSLREEIMPLSAPELSERELLAGINEDDIQEIVGRNQHLAALFGGSPRQAQGSMEDLDTEASMESEHGAARFIDQAHYAGIKRVGMLVDPTTGESIRFRRLVSSNQVELTDEKTGAIIETVSNQQFETLIRDSGFEVV